MSLNEPNVFVKIRGDKEIKGKLIAYDEHLNLMMTDAKEKIRSKQVDPVTQQEMQRIENVEHSMIFIRGDLVIAVSPSHSVIGA